MFGARPPSVTMPWIRSVALNVLAQVRDGLVREQQSIERVDAAVRHRRGVRGTAVIIDADLGDTDARHRRQIDTGRVNHHRRIDALERAGARHQLLAAAFFFGRRSEQADRTAQTDRATAARPSVAPSAAVAIRLWPHAWPMPGSASYSASNATRGPAAAG